MNAISSQDVVRNPLGQKLDTAVAAFISPETVRDNHLWAHASPRISICVPVFRLDAAPLISALSWCSGSALAELVIYDDGSGVPGLTEALARAADGATMAVRIVTCEQNFGRAAARNRAIAQSRANWVLLLDADMWPDSSTFIQEYVSASEAAGRPAVIVGGYSLKQASQEKSFALHRWQSQASECIPHLERRRAPGRYVFTSNVMAHKRVLEMCPFDESFAGWGWEDTDWGMRCEKSCPVLHIDNTATHLGLDDTESLMGKYARSGENFARVAERHPEAFGDSPLMRAALIMRKLPLRGVVRGLCGWVARDHLGLIPVGLRGRALKAWRACVYAEHLK